MKTKSMLGAVVLCAVLVMAAAAMAATVAFPDFASRDLTGKEVSQEIFAGHKLTMVNFWGTYCGPCIDEMPDLGRLGKAMPEGTQLVGIVIDISDKKKLDAADAILKNAKAEFTNLIAVSDMNDYLETLVGVPTTIFVDGAGKIVGEPLVGSRSEADYRKELDKALKLVK